MPGLTISKFQQANLGQNKLKNFFSRAPQHFPFEASHAHGRARVPARARAPRCAWQTFEPHSAAGTRGKASQTFRAELSSISLHESF